MDDDEARVAEEGSADEHARLANLVRKATSDPKQCQMRSELAAYAAKVFNEAGQRLHIAGHILGTDRKEGKSPFNHADDEAVGVSLLLQIASQLVSVSAELLVSGRAYAGAALLRQVVEVENLAWAFETRDEDAARWLRSAKDEREEIFRPAKLRKASGGKFRSKDYGFHCDLGGHPSPSASALIRQDDKAYGQLLLSDLLGHAGRIWDHLISWARIHDVHGQMLLSDHTEMLRRFLAWKAADPMTTMPPP